MNYKPGDTINVNGIDLLILDETENGLFVLAYGLNIKTEFDDKDNIYKGSKLHQQVEKWFLTTHFSSHFRTINLNTVDDISVYDTLTVKAAPLTFDEYRKYSSIIKPYIKGWFWLINKWDINDNSYAAIVYPDGEPTYTYYYNHSGLLVPAFILPKSDIENPLSNFTTKQLLDEISRRNLL